jgi:hypothetical protein
MDLNDGQLKALENLSRKKDGKEVDWISIADARALTELGLAERSREGWEITEEGSAFLKTRAPAPQMVAEPQALHPVVEADEPGETSV